MLGRTHLLLAAAAYAAVALHPVETPLGTATLPALSRSDVWDPRLAFALSVGAAAVGGLAPDIDKTGSSIAHSLGFVTEAAAWVTQHTLGHRGPLHSLAAVALVLVAGAIAGSRLGVAGLGQVLAFGWAAHLAGDACTRRGVPLFWPLTRWHFRIPPGFATGGRAEAVVLALALLACFWWVVGAPVWRGWGMT